MLNGKIDAGCLDMPELDFLAAQSLAQLFGERSGPLDYEFDTAVPGKDRTNRLGKAFNGAVGYRLLQYGLKSRNHMTGQNFLDVSDHPRQCIGEFLGHLQFEGSLHVRLGLALRGHHGLHLLAVNFLEFSLHLEPTLLARFAAEFIEVHLGLWREVKPDFVRLRKLEDFRRGRRRCTEILEISGEACAHSIRHFPEYNSRRRVLHAADGPFAKVAGLPVLGDQSCAKMKMLGRVRAMNAAQPSTICR